MQISRESALEILGLSATASRSEIEERFRERASETHPDHGGSTDQFAQVVAARDHLLDEAHQDLVPAKSNSLIADGQGVGLVTLERDRDLERRRRETSERVTKGLVRTEVNRLTRFRRTAHFLAWLGGGAGAVTLALSATTFRGAGAVENLWIAVVAIASILISIMCAGAGFLISGQISRMEQALDDAAQAMSDRSTFLDLFYEISENFDESITSAWTTNEINDAVRSWSVQGATYRFWKRRRRSYVRGPKRIIHSPQELRRRVLSVFGQLESNPSLADLAWVIGPTGFSRLLIAKGEETQLLIPQETMENGRLRVQHRLALKQSA